MSKCPYCPGAHLAPTDNGSRPRPQTHTVVRCASCMDYSLQHDNGRVFPLTDRKDPDADACSRVIDG